MPLSDIVQQVGPWFWVLGGLLLLVIEIIVPRSLFLWLGIAAIIVGAAAVLVDFAWPVQVTGFAVLAAVFVVVGRRWMKRPGTGGSSRQALRQPAKTLR